MLTKEDGEKDECSDVENLEVLESLTVQADEGGRHEHGEESDGQPEHLQYQHVLAEAVVSTYMVVTRLRSVSKATPTTVGK